jgi:hypothetical protein
MIKSKKEFLKKNRQSKDNDEKIALHKFGGFLNCLNLFDKYLYYLYIECVLLYYQIMAIWQRVSI